VTGQLVIWCALCWIDNGQRTSPVKGWDGAPLCRRHVAECIEANLPKAPAPTVSAPQMLQ
jgi:hypothetical protein